MNILMILSDTTFPPDIRIKKEAKTLIEHGHEVHLLAKGTIMQKKDETIDKIHVHRIYPAFHDRPFIGYFFYFFLFRYLLALKIKSMIKRWKIEVLHVHDLPFGVATVMAGRLCRLPVIFDMHEHYVEMMISTFEVQGREVPLLPSILKLEEKLVCKGATKVIVVAEEQMERIAIQYNINREKIQVVSNTADISLLSEIQMKQKECASEKTKDEFIITYVGGFSKHRGIEVLIDAMPHILIKHGNTRLVLVGDDPLKKRLVELVEGLGIYQNVKFTGWVPFEEAMNYIISSDICVIPYHNTPHTETTIPHKLFHYMFFKKPVLCSDVTPLKRIVTETKCGLIFSAGDPKDLADKLSQLMNDPKEMGAMGENGYLAVVEQYNWEKEGNKLVDLYKRIWEEFPRKKS